MTVNTAQRSTPVSGWRFWIPLLVQVLLVMLIPAQAMYAFLAGKTVILQTGPVDPYDVFRGYYVTLRYDISQLETLKGLPGWDAIEAEHPDLYDYYSGTQLEPAVEFFVVMEEPAAAAPAEPSGEPAPWVPVRVTSDRPLDLPPNQIALKGQFQDGSIYYGLEQYFIPEEQREDINARINQIQNPNEPESFVVEIKVTPQGESVPISFWLEGDRYQF